MERHPLDLVSLTVGGLFVLAGLRLLAGPVDLRALPLHWVGPAALILVGIAILASVRSRTAATRQDDAPGA